MQQPLWFGQISLRYVHGLSTKHDGFGSSLGGFALKGSYEITCHFGHRGFHEVYVKFIIVIYIAIQIRSIWFDWYGMTNDSICKFSMYKSTRRVDQQCDCPMHKDT